MSSLGTYSQIFKRNAVRFFLQRLGAMSHIQTPSNYLISTHQEQEVPKHKTITISFRIGM